MVLKGTSGTLSQTLDFRKIVPRHVDRKCCQQLTDDHLQFIMLSIQLLYSVVSVTQHVCMCPPVAVEICFTHGIRAHGQRYSRQDGHLKGGKLTENKISSDDV